MRRNVLVASSRSRGTAKKPTNVSINGALLRQARDLGINLSAALEQALTQLIQQRQRAAWRTENQPAMDAYNACLEKHGAFSDGLRSF